jgi:hypothetical protein
MKWTRLIHILSTPGKDEKITVVDPSHPLFGREFPVSYLTRHPTDGRRYVLAEFKNGLVLRIPVASTNLGYFKRDRVVTKLTLEAVEELLRVAYECEALHVDGSTKGLAQAASKDQKGDRKRFNFGSRGGDV